MTDKEFIQKSRDLEKAYESLKPGDPVTPELMQKILIVMQGMSERDYPAETPEWLNYFNSLTKP